jgi:effector-binding domain-containing protein
MKKILIILVALFGIYLILCLVGPAKIHVEKRIDINSPAESVKSKLADYRFFHESWSPWTERDPGMKKSFEGNAGQPGHKLSWESDKKEVGKGSMTYKYTRNDTVMHSLFFEGEGEGPVFHVVKGDETKSSVTWVMANDVPFFARVFMLFMDVEKMVGTDFEKGLAKLKTALESLPAIKNYEVKEILWEAKTFYGIKTTTTFDKLAAFFGESYGKIGEACGKAKAQPMGAPKAIYFKVDEQAMSGEVAAVMEFDSKTKLDGLEKWETAAGNVLLIEYYGEYDKTVGAHEAMDKYMKEKNLTQILCIEEYVTDPVVEKDPNKWLTNIYYLVK